MYVCVCVVDMCVCIYMHTLHTCGLRRWFFNSIFIYLLSKICLVTCSTLQSIFIKRYLSFDHSHMLLTFRILVVLILFFLPTGRRNGLEEWKNLAMSLGWLVRLNWWGWGLSMRIYSECSDRKIIESVFSLKLLWWLGPEVLN